MTTTNNTAISEGGALAPLPMAKAPNSSIAISQPVEYDSAAARVFRYLDANHYVSHWEGPVRGAWDAPVTFRQLAGLLPEGFTFARTEDEPQGVRRTVVATRGEGDGSDAAVLLNSYGGGSHLFVEVAAMDPDDAAAIGEAILAKVPEPAPEDQNVQWLRTWYFGGGDIDSTSKRIVTEDWNEIRSNYPGAVQPDLDTLMQYRPSDTDDRSGRIILLHGAPGTGKTSVVRALCNAWFEWCQPELLVDAEVVFSEAKYLMQVLGRSARRGGEDRGDLWRLLIAEDADLYVGDASSTKENPALDRLLNVGDGLLAQGQRVLVLLSTNNKVSSLPPALTRPGRCLSVHEFLPFEPKEARAWLGDGAKGVTRSMTLAELYEKRGNATRIGAPTETTRSGIYL